MKCYKGFDKDLKCRGFQYEIGKEYEENTADICHKGFHACENPMDVFGYYNPADSRYCEVDLDTNEQTEEDSKRVGKKIKIETEIGLSGLIQAGVKFILEKVDFKSAKENNTGTQSAATNTGTQSAATNTGTQSAATNTGNWSAATNTGDWSAATNTGDWSAATNTGNQSAATNTGDWSAATNTGNQSAATNTGDWSAATNTGNQSAATVGGAENIAVVTGYGSKAKGAVGCWLVLTERDEKMHILGVQAVCVDGETIKADTFYMLKNGAIIEVDE
nr:MAG TPA: cytoskeletal protein [Caudoviricetes sp.]